LIDLLFYCLQNKSSRSKRQKNLALWRSIKSTLNKDQRKNHPKNKKINDEGRKPQKAAKSEKNENLKPRLTGKSQKKQKPCLSIDKKLELFCPTDFFEPFSYQVLYFFGFFWKEIYMKQYLFKRYVGYKKYIFSFFKKTLT